ncbi:MAG TPA: Uma2 family endonuclease [Humisphaera sp.]|jgi:Uma2 family endonuclease|nr:Uma2 family endonuclease [Humisphaera sp.]
MRTTIESPDPPQRFVMSGVSWQYYESTLEQVGDRPIRVSFLDGVLELMSPLPEHDSEKKAIGDLIAILTLERGIPRKSYGSTTFRIEERAAGAEADESFYFFDIESVKGMKRFDPAIHRSPDLWIEVDLLSPSVPREPICARLGVPEIWRYSEERLTVRVLSANGTYVDSPASRLFPFLPMSGFASFIPKMIEGDETRVLLEFQEWARNLPQ